MNEMTEKYLDTFPELENDKFIGEAIENYVMKKVYRFVFEHPSESEFN